MVKETPNISTETRVDLMVCLLILPCLAAVFPLEEWIGWRASDVIIYLVWTYLCWYLGRHFLPGMFAAGKGRLWSGLAILFLTVVVTFLMNLRQVPFPQESGTDHPARLYLYQQAIWVLYFAAMGTGLATGLLARKLRELASAQDAEEKTLAVRAAVETRAAAAVAGETVTVKADYKDVTIPLSAIQYIEARNNYACLHLDYQDDVVSQITMKSLLEMLPEGKFLRIHRSYIVPLHRIESKKATSVKLIGVDAPLPVGRAHKENLK
ncbi:MAG: LytTR family transcriptional regulator [Bacteroidales bacterium]|nr:LytTR family transcriptional regulator [Bacteroidales bacterium]